MTTFVLIVVPGVACGGWLLARARPLKRDAAPTLVTTTSVIVPARDEAASLPRLLRSLQEQRTAPLEILVVDDGSTDDTARLAAEAGVTVLTAPPLPQGWVGKTWACHIGAVAGRGEHLVFLDADTWLAPDGLERLLATQADHPTGLLSVAPFHVVRRSYEQLSAFANLVPMLASGGFSPGGDGSTRLAFGPCLVTSAASYAAVGGHAAVAGHVIEDLHLARRYRAAGFPVHVRAGAAQVRYRMYPAGPGALVDGWTKNLAGGARLAALGPTIGTLWWVSASAATLAAALCLMFSRSSVNAVAVAGAWTAIALELRWMLRRIGSFRWWTAVGFPVSLVAFLLLFARSFAWRVGRRSVHWRGRDIDARVG